MYNDIYTKKFFINEYYNTPLLESDNFKVVASLGAMLEGWLLIIPKSHILSFAYLKPELQIEFYRLHSRVINLLKLVYNSEVCVFENGAIQKETKIGCGVDYAHIHYVPIKFDLKNEVSKYYSYDLKWNEIKNISFLSEFKKIQSPYIYTISSNKEFVASIQNPKSQLIRQLIANKLGLSDKYDWKAYPFNENIYNTINKIKEDNLIFTNPCLEYEFI